MKGGANMYTYIVENGKLDIHTPWLKDNLLVKKQVIHRPGSIITKFKYPNGWQVEIHQTAKRFVIFSNCELVQNPDGSYDSPAEISRTD